MYVVTITGNIVIPGTSATCWVFYSLAEAEEFASCLHARFDGIETLLSESGDPTDVFEHWSF